MPKALFIILPIILVLLVLAVIVGINVNIVKNHASTLKDDFELILDCAKEKDAQGAAVALDKSYEDLDKLQTSLDGSFWKTASKISRVNKELTVGYDLIAVVETAQDELLTPLIALMKEQPLDQLKVGDKGFNVTLINHYLDFLEEKMPLIEAMVSEITGIDTESILGSYVDKYKDKIFSLLDSYNQAAPLLPMLRAILGDGEDRFYLLVAQNSAEIRASGGFPGAVGSIRIKDGVMTIGNFESVYDVLSDYTSYEAGLMQDELNIFGGWITAPRDACFMAAFERTALIWALGNEDYQREQGAIDHTEWDGYADEDGDYFYDKRAAVADEDGDGWDDNYDPYAPWRPTFVQPVDGVVSMTPIIIQKLLKGVGDITLSDGSVLNSENATKMLQYDLYHKYFNWDTFTNESYELSDDLFAETAKIAMGEFVSSFEISKFADYYELFTSAAEENVLKIWMRDEEEEQVMVDAGVAGILNNDPQDPICDIYFSMADPSKMGWYLDINTEVSEPTVNDDGSKSYDVKVTLHNSISQEDVERSTYYILGAYYFGGIRGYVHVFAPQDGYFESIEAENWYTHIFQANYQEKEVAYNLDILINPGESEVFYFTMRTAPDVSAPLRVRTTPTLTAYR